MTTADVQATQRDLAKRYPALFYQPVEGNDWEQWRARMWNQMVDQFGYPGLAPLEQYMKRSHRERRCVECGEPGTVNQVSVIIPAVADYWMCDACDTYWKERLT